MIFYNLILTTGSNWVNEENSWKSSWCHDLFFLIYMYADYNCIIYDWLSKMLLLCHFLKSEFPYGRFICCLIWHHLICYLLLPSCLNTNIYIFGPFWNMLMKLNCLTNFTINSNPPLFPMFLFRSSGVPPPRRGQPSPPQWYVTVPSVLNGPLTWQTLCENNMSLRVKHLNGTIRISFIITLENI